MAQTQSMIRWIGQSMKGKKGECLYPKNDPDACYIIDGLTEMSDGYMNCWNLYMKPPPDEKAVKELCAGKWTEFLGHVNDALCRNSNPNFLVGNCMTTADITCGSYMLRFVLNDKHPHKQLFQAEVMKFPKVSNWCMKTIGPSFKAWFDQEPGGMLNYML